MGTAGSGSWKQHRVRTEVGDAVPCHPCSQSLPSSVAGDAEGLRGPRPAPRVLGALLGNPKPDTQAPGRPGRPSLAEPHSLGGFSLLCAFAALLAASHLGWSSI